MKVVILCGGQGTRLREETEYRPKPLVEIGGKAILWHIMKLYAHYGHSEFVLCLGYRGELIKQYFLNYEAMNNDFTLALGNKDDIKFHQAHREQGFKITLADTGLDTMTGGRVKRIERYINDDTFMVTYGDGLSDVNVDKLLEFHKSHGKIATITTVQPISRFGLVDIDSNHRVSKFVEKPPQADTWINAGFFVFNREFFKYLNADANNVLEREPLEKLAQNGQLMAYQHRGSFHAMDTYREYLQLNELWKSGKADWAVWKDAERKML